MVTRVRIEAEGSTPSEVEQILYAAHKALQPSLESMAPWDALYGVQDAHGSRPALTDAQDGEMVIERFAKDLKGEAGHGAVFFRGRMTTHYSPRTPALDLQFRQDTGAYVES